MTRVNRDYDYSANPHLTAFKSFVRSGSAKHPWIGEQEKKARSILGRIPNLPIPDDLDPLLKIQAEDQGLILTPFDDLDSLRVEVVPEVYLSGWKLLRDYNLQLANHPARIQALRALEAKGFAPPPALKGVLDSEATFKHLLQLADLGQAIELTLFQHDGVAMTKFADDIDKVMAKKADSKTRASIEKIIDRLLVKRRVHRTELLATGPFTLINGKAFSYIGIGAMPDIVGSVLMGETAAKMGMTFGIPEIGIFSNPKKQALLAQAILSRLRTDDPLLTGRSKEDKEFIVNHWRSTPTGIVEDNVEEGLRRAQELAKVGVTSFRIYGHTRGGDIIKTVRALRREHPRSLITAGQISDVDVALACEYEGADAIVIGVGSGGRCTTAYLSQLIPTMALLTWRLRGLLKIPIIGEGGAVNEPIVSALTGISMINGSGSIGGGTLEQPGGVYFLTRDGEHFFKPYGGEASDRFKWLSGRKYGGTGLTYFPEGEQTFRELIQLEESMTQKVIRHWERVVLGAVVLGVDAGPFTIQVLQQLDPSPLWKKSRTATFIQETH